MKNYGKSMFSHLNSFLLIFPSGWRTKKFLYCLSTWMEKKIFFNDCCQETLLWWGESIKKQQQFDKKRYLFFHGSLHAPILKTSLQHFTEIATTRTKPHIYTSSLVTAVFLEMKSRSSSVSPTLFPFTQPILRRRPERKNWGIYREKEKAVDWENTCLTKNRLCRESAIKIDLFLAEKRKTGQV